MPSCAVARYVHPEESRKPVVLKSKNNALLSVDSSILLEDRMVLGRALRKALASISAYELLENSVGIAVLDIHVTLDVAFLAAIETNTSYCLLWDPRKQSFVGALSSSDYIKIVLYAHDAYTFHGDVGVLGSLQHMSIENFAHQTWAGKTFLTTPCVTAYLGEDTAESIFRKLYEEHIHHIPVLAAQKQPTVCGVVTYQPIMMAIVDVIGTLGNRLVLETSTFELGIGSYGDFRSLQVVTMDSTLEQAFRIFLKHGVRILPVVDDDGTVLDVLSRNDLLSLEPTTGGIDLRMCVRDVLPEKAPGDFNDIYVYCKEDSLHRVICHMAWCGIHSLIAVDDQHRLTGLFSVGDLARFLHEIIQSSSVDA